MPLGEEEDVGVGEGVCSGEGEGVRDDDAEVVVG